MKNIVAPNDLDELLVSSSLEESSSRLSPLQDTPFHPSDMLFAQAQPVRSYQPYPWSILNSMLDIVDNKTHGRAGQLQRIVSYLFFGGLAAVVNLIAFAIMLRLMPGDNPIQNTIAYAVAAELSILANFIPNDRFTFNTLPGAQRPCLQLCIRFHSTCFVATLITSQYQILLKFP